MSRKHFVRIAWALRNANPRVLAKLDIASDAYVFAMAQWERDVMTMAEVLASFNAAFKWETFYRAAGLHIRPDGSLYPMTPPVYS